MSSERKNPFEVSYDFEPQWGRAHAMQDPLKPKSQPRSGHPRFYQLLDEIGALHSLKNADFSGGLINKPMGNFERVSAIAKLYPGMDWDSPFGVALMYALKQLDAALILRSQKKESVTGEPVGSRLKDIAIYMLIAMILEEDERTKEYEPGVVSFHNPLGL